MTEPALKVREVAELLGIRQHGVLGLIGSGQLNASDVSQRPGGRPRWRIMPADLERFLLTRRRQPPAPRRRKRKLSEITTYF